MGTSSHERPLNTSAIFGCGTHLAVYTSVNLGTQVETPPEGPQNINSGICNSDSVYSLHPHIEVFFFCHFSQAKTLAKSWIEGMEQAEFDQ